MDSRTDRFLLKACVRCGGDLALDDGDWLCLQCGRYYYAHPMPAMLPHWREWLARPLPGDGGPAPPKSAAAAGIPAVVLLGPGRLWHRAVCASVFVPSVFVQ